MPRFWSHDRTLAAAAVASTRFGRWTTTAFAVVIAPSFADIFFNNCFKNGVLPITLAGIGHRGDLFQRAAANSPYQLTVDLEHQTISDGQGLKIDFEVDPSRRHNLLQRTRRHRPNAAARRQDHRLRSGAELVAAAEPAQ